MRHIEVASTWAEVHSQSAKRHIPVSAAMTHMRRLAVAHDILRSIRTADYWREPGIFGNRGFVWCNVDDVLAKRWLSGKIHS